MKHCRSETTRIRQRGAGANGSAALAYRLRYIANGFAGVDGIITCITVARVIAGSANEVIIIIVASQVIIARVTFETVLTLATFEQVIARTTAN